MDVAGIRRGGIHAARVLRVADVGVTLEGSVNDQLAGGIYAAPTTGTRRAATRWLWPCDAGHTGLPGKIWQIAPYSLPLFEGQADTGD